jgi:hypothetical protein
MVYQVWEEKAGAGGKFTSREYIEDDDSSSDDARPADAKPVSPRRYTLPLVSILALNLKCFF